MKKKTPHAHKLPPAIETSPSLAAALAENERLTKLLDELRQEIVALKQENAALKQENIALRDRLNQNSTNSNQPPAQDSPFGESQKQADSAAREAEERAESKAKKSRPYLKAPANHCSSRTKSSPACPGRAPLAAVSSAWICARASLISGSNCARIPFGWCISGGRSVAVPGAGSG